LFFWVSFRCCVAILWTRRRNDPTRSQCGAPHLFFSGFVPHKIWPCSPLLRCPSRPCSSPPAEDHHEDLCAPISSLSELHRRGAPDLTSTPLPLASCSVPPLSEAGSAGVEPARTSRSTWLSGPPRRAHSLTASPLLPPGRTPVLHREGGGGHAVRLHRGGHWRFIFLASLGLGDPLIVPFISGQDPVRRPAPVHGGIPCLLFFPVLCLLPRPLMRDTGIWCGPIMPADFGRWRPATAVKKRMVVFNAHV
jgi:hypothetical protein